MGLRLRRIDMLKSSGLERIRTTCGGGQIDSRLARRPVLPSTLPGGKLHASYTHEQSSVPDLGSILLAEDDAPMRVLLASALRKYGYQVVATSSGAALLSALKDRQFDLVLLDMVMPPPNGLETLRILRDQYDSASLPVVMLTGIGESDAVVAALEAGANDYLTKPFDMAVIAARVRTHVTLRRQAADLKAASQRLQEELEAAAAVQRAALPAPDLRFGPYRFAREYEPCEQLSGDGLNIMPLSGRHVGFYVLDASGHGVRAALLSAAVGRLLLPVAGEAGIVTQPGSLLTRPLTSLLTPSVEATLPSVVATRLSRRFQSTAAGGQLFTMIYGLLDVETGELLYTTAGHPGPILLPANGTPQQLPGGGLILGYGPDTQPGYSDRPVRLEPGDRLLFYTDGVAEARAPDGRELGEAGLLEALSELCNAAADAPADANALVQAVSAACRRWTDGAPPDDDRSLLVVERERG